MSTLNLLAGSLSIFSMLACQADMPDESPFEIGHAVGTNKNKKLEETSGLVASEKNHGYLWAHNDGGHPAEIFLLDENTAKSIKAFGLSKARNRDWEDIALGPGPEENVNYLYIGDIGDNLANFPVKYVYRIREPSMDGPEDIVDFDTLIIKLEDEPRDAEALMVDPVSRNLYLISKREHSVRLYEVPFPFTTDTLIAHSICKLPYRSITAADISADGKEVLIKNYDQIFYWKKKGDETIPDLLKTPAIRLAYDRELQGEAIAWARDGSGFYSLGENAKGERAKLFFYKRKLIHY